MLTKCIIICFTLIYLSSFFFFVITRAFLFLYIQRGGECRGEEEEAAQT